MFRGHGPLMKWTIEVFLIMGQIICPLSQESWSLPSSTAKQTQACEFTAAGQCPAMGSAWLESGPRASLTGQHQWPHRGTDGSAEPHYTQSKPTHLPRSSAKENTQTCRKQMRGQFQDEKDHIQRACQYENTLRSWDKLRKTMHKRERLIGMCEDYLSQKSVCYRLILLQITTDCCQLSSPRNFTNCLKFLR